LSWVEETIGMSNKVISNDGDELKVLLSSSSRQCDIVKVATDDMDLQELLELLFKFEKQNGCIFVGSQTKKTMNIQSFQALFNFCFTHVCNLQFIYSCNF
jgi:hypothetical protein